MKRNRRVKQRSQFAWRSGQAAALIFVGFIAMMVYLNKDQCCSAISQDISKAERELKALDGEFQREAARWEELRTPDNVHRQLVYFGAEMQLPQPEQVVRMGGDGRPVPGQLSVMRAQARMSGGIAKQLAQASPRPVVRQVARQAARQISRQQPKPVQRQQTRQVARRRR